MIKIRKLKNMNRTYYFVITFTRYDGSEAKKSYSNMLPSPRSEKKKRK